VGFAGIFSIEPLDPKGVKGFEGEVFNLENRKTGSW
jgi:hypothetical protein